MRIGEILKNKRMESAYSQADVAKELFVSRQTISNWELGKTYPDIEKLIALSDFYQISLDQLVKEDKQMLAKVKEDSQTFKRLKKHKRLFYFFDHAAVYFSGAATVTLFLDSSSDNLFWLLFGLVGLFGLISLYNWIFVKPDEEYWFGRRFF